MKLLIHSVHSSPRLDYITDVILRRWYSIDYAITSQLAEIQTYDGPVLQYGPTRLLPDLPWLPAVPLLFEEDTAAARPTVIHTDLQQPGFYATFSGDWPIDIFALAFYCLSRYEEYQPYVADLHHRFPASASLAAQHDFLDFPIVDYWANKLVTDLKKRFPGLAVQWPAYAFAPGYDIDLPWAYRHRGWRGLAAAVRESLTGQWSLWQARMAVWQGRQPDPYDTFSLLDAWHTSYQLQPIYFWLVARRGTYDTNPSADLPAVKRIIRGVAADYLIGIHPSYASNEQPHLLREEIDRLQAIIGRPVRHSRQHFLRLRFPATYRSLLAAGIEEDHSLGYADRAGFRAGTARSFPWYDLSAEEATPLLLHPLTLMDVTLRQYEDLSPDAARERIAYFIEIIRQHGGTFRPLWHNSSFASTLGWAGWQAVYTFLLEQAVNTNK